MTVAKCGVSRANEPAAPPPTAGVQLVLPGADKAVRLRAECGDICGSQEASRPIISGAMRCASEGEEGEEGGSKVNRRCGDLIRRHMTCWFPLCL